MGVNRTGCRPRWVRLETDAPSHYHDPNKPKESKINIIVDNDLKIVGISALKGGRMRVALECQTNSKVGSSGHIHVELYRTGQESAKDSAEYTVVDAPKHQDKKKTNTFPEFEIIKVEGPSDEKWSNISEDNTDITIHASRATLSEGTLYIYYSAAFPKFSEEAKRWAGLDLQKAGSFERRYEVWLAVHALLLQEQEEETTAEQDAGEDVAEYFRRQERCRAAILATMVASQEVKVGDLTADTDD